MRALLALTTGAARAQPEGAARWTIAVAADKADDVVLANGAPIHRFAKVESKDGLSTASIPLAPWLVNGRNTIEVRVDRLAPGGEVKAKLAKSEDDGFGGWRPVAAGQAATFEEQADGLPRWRFLDAEPMGADEAGLRKAVAALHAAAAKRDVKTMLAIGKPYFDDLSKIYGAPPPGYERELAAELKKAKLRPLPAELRISTAHDGKLAIVETLGGEAPIRAEARDGHMDLGRYWAKLDGQWRTVR
jgi:hypothetical protein